MSKLVMYVKRSQAFDLGSFGNKVVIGVDLPVEFDPEQDNPIEIAAKTQIQLSSLIKQEVIRCGYMPFISMQKQQQNGMPRPEVVELFEGAIVERDE